MMYLTMFEENCGYAPFTYYKYIMPEIASSIYSTKKPLIDSWYQALLANATNMSMIE